MLVEVEPVTTTYFAFAFDGTEESVAGFLAECGADGPLAGYISPTEWKVTNPFMTLEQAPTRPVGFVVVCSREPSGTVRIVEDFPSMEAIGVRWQPA